LITKMEVFSRNPSVPELPVAGFAPNLASLDPIVIRDIQGLGPVKATISSTPFATGRGELFQGSSIPTRNIVLSLGFNPNWIDQTMASLRHILYRYFMPQLWTKLRFISDEIPIVGIDGIVESCEPNMFSQDPEMQISIMCPKPDFLEVNSTLISGIVDDGTTEVIIDYRGSVPAGFELQIKPSDDLPAYTGDVTIANISVDGAQAFQALDVTVDDTKYLMMNTAKTSRKLHYVMADESPSVNILGKMASGSIWPELSPGENIFAIEASETGMKWVLGYFNRYGGI
jgi:hypothetical protein